MHDAALGSVHVLLTQTAGSMQLAMFDPHAAPSEAIDPHVPCVVWVEPLQVPSFAHNVYVLDEAE